VIITKRIVEEIVSQGITLEVKLIVVFFLFFGIFDIDTECDQTIHWKPSMIVDEPQLS
jgi:hypothetical protein